MGRGVGGDCILVPSDIFPPNIRIVLKYVLRGDETRW